MIIMHICIDMENWDDYRIFLSVVRNGTLSAASEILNRTQPTLGRRITSLENRIGQKLFIRQGKKLILTEFGRRLLNDIEEMQISALKVNRTVSSAQNETLNGEVRVTSTEGIGSFWLPSILSKFSHKHKSLRLEIITGGSAFDLSSREADIALRLYAPKEPYLIAQKMGVLKFGLYASTSYLDGRQQPTTETDLKVHKLIGYPGKSDHRPEMDWLAEIMPDTHFKCVANSAISQATAAQSGVGIALIPCYLAKYFSGLQQLLAQLPIPGREFWMAAHQDMRNAPNVDALWDHIKSNIREEKSFFE